MSRLSACVAATTVLLPWLSIGSANAADHGLAPRAAHARHQEAMADCGVCGCWQPEYVHHPEVVYKYPDDPRYTLTSEPAYAPGRVHTYVHNWF
jgi:hypothetical protein